MEISALISVIIFLGGIFGWNFIDYFIKLYHNQNIFKKIGWIAEKENHNICYDEFVSLRSSNLESYIIEKQSNFNISDKFKLIYSDEKEMAELEECLKLFKVDIVKDYFHGFLLMSKKVCKLTSLEYFFYSLFNYLGTQLSMDKSTIKDKIYDYKRREGTYSYYTLTDFGRVCYKVYLITTIFVENNPNIKKLFEYIDPKLKVTSMEYLNKNEVFF